MLVPGGLDDQTILLSWGYISNSLFSISSADLGGFYVYKALFDHLLNPFNSNQPLSTLILSGGLSVFGPYFFIFACLLSVVATFFIARLLFRNYRYSYAWALMFTFSSYMWSHLWKHIDLLQLWIFPLFFLVLKRFFTNSSVKNAVILGAFLAAAALISNYAGFITFIYFFIACAVIVIYELLRDRKINFLVIKRGLLTALIFIALSFAFLLPYIKANFLGYQQVGRTVSRTYEDFFTFSSRPWYFFIPPVKNPLFGNFPTMVLESIKQTDYFLADDYFANEHSGNYFGLFFLITSVALIAWSYRYSDDTRKKIVVYMLCSAVLFSFLMPPFFTINDVRIFTPGYVIYKFFPMFRVTSRLSIILLLNQLVLTAYIINVNFQKIRDRFKYLNLFMVFLTSVTLIETFIPFSIEIKETPPEVYSYLNKNTPKNTVFAVYPNNATLDALYWIYIHQRNLINPKYFANEELSAKEFTENLNTVPGLDKLIQLEGEYLIVFKNASDEDKMFFENNSKLSLIKEFEESYLFKSGTNPNK